MVSRSLQLAAEPKFSRSFIWVEALLEAYMTHRISDGESAMGPNLDEGLGV